MFWDSIWFLNFCLKFDLKVKSVRLNKVYSPTQCGAWPGWQTCCRGGWRCSSWWGRWRWGSLWGGWRSNCRPGGRRQDSSSSRLHFGKKYITKISNALALNLFINVWFWTWVGWRWNRRRVVRRQLCNQIEPRQQAYLQTSKRQLIVMHFEICIGGMVLVI